MVGYDGHLTAQITESFPDMKYTEALGFFIRNMAGIKTYAIICNRDNNPFIMFFNREADILRLSMFNNVSEQLPNYLE